MNRRDFLTPDVRVLLEKGKEAVKHIAGAAKVRAAAIGEVVIKETSPDAIFDRLLARRMNYLRKGGLDAKGARKAILERTEADIRRLEKKPRRPKEA